MDNRHMLKYIYALELYSTYALHSTPSHLSGEGRGTRERNVSYFTVLNTVHVKLLQIE